MFLTKQNCTNFTFVPRERGGEGIIRANLYNREGKLILHLWTNIIFVGLKKGVRCMVP